MLVWLCVLLALSSAQVDDEDVQRAHHQYANALRHDGKKRVLTCDMSNVEKLVKKNKLLYVLFWLDQADNPKEQLSKKDLAVLEVAAQVFEAESIKFCTCEIMANQKFAMSADVKYTGMVKIFNHARPTTYNGQRSIDVILPFVKKMLESAGNIVASKSEKKQFDSVDLPKVIAYFDKDSKEFDEYRKAAMSFHPMILFYVVHDVKLAKSFHIKRKNTIVFMKPREKSVTFPSKEDITERKVYNFIRDNKRERLKKMLLENIHEIWAIDMVGYSVPIFAIQKTEEGKSMIAFAKTLSKQFEKTANLSFVWIDPQLFPSMHDYWEKTFGVDPSHPAVGVVDVHKQASSWFERSDTDDTDASWKLNDVKKWLQAILKGDILLTPMKDYTPTPPPPQTPQNDGEEKDEL